MITVLTGPGGSGKTSFLERSLADIFARRPGLDGYLSLRVPDGGETAGYDLLDVRTRARTPFLRRRGEPSWQKVGPFSLLPEGLGAAEALIRRGRPGEGLIVDEIGPLELAGGGVWPAFTEVLSSGDRPAIAVVRELLLADFLAKVPGREARVVRIAEAAAGLSALEGAGEP